MRIPLNFIDIAVILSNHLGDMILTTPLGRTLSQGGHKVCVGCVTMGIRMVW